MHRYLGLVGFIIVVRDDTKKRRFVWNLQVLDEEVNVLFATFENFRQAFFDLYWVRDGVNMLLIRGFPRCPGAWLFGTRLEDQKKKDGWALRVKKVEDGERCICQVERGGTLVLWEIFQISFSSAFSVVSHSV